MTLHNLIGPWLYWPIAIVAISGSVTWTINCISVTYSEILKQIAEIKRVASKPD